MTATRSAGAFRFRFVRLGSLIVAAQPDRGDARTRKGDYHDLNLPPRHGYVAFHFWLTRNEKVDAIIQLGAHGTLEWLPGKAVALSEACAPEVLIGPTPVVYPFIVNNPGEAAQAKRRIGAATIGHLTPPLIAAGSHGATLELEGLFDEFAEAQALDPRRARAIAALILERGRETGLLEECAAEGKPPEEALVALDAWLCDLKDMRVGDGLHVFGRSPESADGFAGLGLDAAARETLSERVAACGAAESLGLIRALGGCFVAPGPAGAPARGRLDVLPTGRNLYAIDPRAAPTRNAWEIGRRAAEEVLARYAQDHGDWPKRIVIDLWGSATMRTGGDDLAQAFALIGCRPVWDLSSSRVSGFEVLPLAMLGRPTCRRDVAHFRPVPRHLSEPDRALRLRRSRCRGPRGERRRQSARRTRRRKPRTGVWRRAGRLRRRTRTADRRRRLGGAVGAGGGLSRRDQPRL